MSVPFYCIRFMMLQMLDPGRSSGNFLALSIMTLGSWGGGGCFWSQGKCWIVMTSSTRYLKMTAFLKKILSFYHFCMLELARSHKNRVKQDMNK